MDHPEMKKLNQLGALRAGGTGAGIYVENRTAGEIDVKLEVRGNKLVIVLLPGRTPSGLILPS